MKEVPKRNRCQSTKQDKWSDCQALMDASSKEDGIFTIYPFQNEEGIKVLCDMTMETGWIVVQRRSDGSVNFNRSWADYKDGFGSMDGEFWLGNKILHKLTDTEGIWTIRLDLTNEHNNTGYLIETPFHIGPDDYTMSSKPTVGRYCGLALGMEDRSIPDVRITASSYHSSRFQPSNARLNLQHSWIPVRGQYQDSWLQVDMGTEPVQIEGVITQGIADYNEYVTHYQVQHSLDGISWLYVNETSTPQTFHGNTDRNTPVTNIFKQPIRARYIRIRPTAWEYSPSLRIELIGCRVGRYCGHALGMEDRSIPDDRVTASSKYNLIYQPSKARLNLNFCWSPAIALQKDSWLQVYMGTEPVQIEGIITQGNPDRDYYVTQYHVQYSLDGIAWLYVIETSTPQTFHGNTDRNTPVTNIFNQPIQARYIRIRPTSWKDYPELRIELLGCRVDGVCGHSLGMEDGSIPDDWITTSSSDEVKCSVNSKGRLSVLGGWCPSVSDGGNAWYQVDLQHPALIQGVLTQGNHHTHYWVSKFLVSYSDNAQGWRYIGGTSKDNAQRFTGNTDQYTTVANMFHKEITTRYIRIIPTLYHADRPSLCVELLGCNERWFCLHRLGMGDGSIPDYSITASSTNGKVDGNCQPSNARLTQSANSHTIGWCPEPNDKKPWLQIDLDIRTTVEGIMMLQGSDQDTSVDMSYEYQLEYSDDKSTWHNMNSTQIIRRNTTSSSEATSMFNPPITARFIRIILNQTNGSLWIRIELLGCKVHWVCGQQLGMEDRSIPDSHITASSTKQDETGTPSVCQPSNGRLNLVNGGWCPADTDKDFSWLEIDLLMVTSIEGVIIQGLDNDTLNWHVKSFQVEYSLNNNTWYYVTGHGVSTGQPQKFHGHTDQSTAVTNKFEQPIRARFIRIRPITYEGYPAMRIELIGCRSGILETANNQAFSVHHRTHLNQDETNCPSLNSEGGWWFNRCSGNQGVDNNLNAEYIQPGDVMGPYKRVIRATEWNGSRIVKTEIKIRRQYPPRG